MQNTFDKDKQPLEWLLCEMNNAQSTAENLLTQILNKPTGSSTPQTSIVLFKTPTQLQNFWNGIPDSKTLHIVKMLFSSILNPDKSPASLDYQNSAFDTSITFVALSITAGYSNGVPSVTNNPQLIIENIKLPKAGSNLNANTAGGIYLEYILE